MKVFEHEALLNNLVQQYQAQLIQIALSYVKDLYTAEDIVQQVWIKYYFRIQERGTNSERSTYAWLYRVTVNQSIDFLRRFYSKNVKCVDSVEIMDHLQKDNLHSLEEGMLDKWRKEEICQKINALPNKYLRVIVYFYFDDLSYEEIATILNIHISTVRSRLHRAKFLMRNMYIKELTYQ